MFDFSVLKSNIMNIVHDIKLFILKKRKKAGGE